MGSVFYNMKIKEITKEDASILLKKVTSNEHLTRDETSSFFKAILTASVFYNRSSPSAIKK